MVGKILRVNPFVARTKRNPERTEQLGAFALLKDISPFSCDLFFADVNSQLKHKNITADIKVDSNSKRSLLLSCIILGVGMDNSFCVLITQHTVKNNDLSKCGIKGLSIKSKMDDTTFKLDAILDTPLLMYRVYSMLM